MGKTIASTYEILEKIGAGGGANVYLGRHLRLNKLVVLKADKRKITTREEILRREVDVLKNLSQEYIPQVYDFFVEDDTVYTVIDYVDGESLDNPLKRGERFSQTQVIAWAKQILSALSYLHSPTHGSPPHGYVHSDVKPANIMVRSNGDICLIDFNIALAIGEGSTVGVSPGYASPEHYGLDFSSGSYNYDPPNVVRGGVFSTITSGRRRSGTQSSTFPVTGAGATSSNLFPTSASVSNFRKVVPDARSDIYSLGATLYHLLSGKRPERDATQVVPLADQEVSPQISEIIAKAMSPNPELRYQSADEMLWAFENLHQNDIRSIRLKRQNLIAGVCLGLALLVGAGTTFVGLRQMETLERNRALAADSVTAFSAGDVDLACAKAREALPDRLNLFNPSYTPEAVRALTNALGVYDLGDGFKRYSAISLPGQPLRLKLSSEGKYLAVMLQGAVHLYETETGEELEQFPANPSARSDMVFTKDDCLLFAGAEGIQAYSVPEGKVLWTGKPATRISLSGDENRVATVYQDESFGYVYDATTGALVQTLDFKGKSQKVAQRDVLFGKNYDLLALNQDGTYCAVSFSDGSLLLYKAETGKSATMLDRSEFQKFDGGFCGDLLVYSVVGASGTGYGWIDVQTRKERLINKMPEEMYTVTAENEAFFSYDRHIQRFNLETKKSEKLFDVSGKITAFSVSGSFIAVATEDGRLSIYNMDGNLLESSDAAQIQMMDMGGEYLASGSSNSNQITIKKEEESQGEYLFRYDPAYRHKEARLSGDRQTVMLFGPTGFRLYRLSDGELLEQLDIPEEEQGDYVDMQYRREEGRLDMIREDGWTVPYSTADGAPLPEFQGEVPNPNLSEDYELDQWIIKRPIDKQPVIYDREKGSKVNTINENGQLIYAYQVDQYVILHFMYKDQNKNTNAAFYGLILDENAQVIADLPDFSDVLPDGTLVFDDQRGNLRSVRIISIEDLLSLEMQRRNE